MTTLLIILFILLGLCLIGDVIYCFVKPHDTDCIDIAAVVVFGMLLGIFISVWEQSKIPTAMDVYRGKTELEITSVNDVPRDTVVVWKGGIEK